MKYKEFIREEIIMTLPKQRKYPVKVSVIKYRGTTIPTAVLTKYRKIWHVREITSIKKGPFPYGGTGLSFFVRFHEKGDRIYQLCHDKHSLKWHTYVDDLGNGDLSYLTPHYKNERKYG